MSLNHDPLLTLDAWSASSLLQKAIRRGEAELTERALASLQRHRGKAVWRRLAGIALEDVGIADPELVWDAVRLATDEEARAKCPEQLLFTIASKLAAAPKDRSADYAYCSATKLLTAQAERRVFDRLSLNERLAIATADLEPITRRAVAALSACCSANGSKAVVEPKRAQHFAEAFPEVPQPLISSMLALTGARTHLFGPVLVLVWSQLSFVGGRTGVSYPELPPTEWFGGAPLYTFDKHTAVGKRAITKFVRECCALRDVLRQHVPAQNWIAASAMAAFYADAAPVSFRLEWPFADLLWDSGFAADMEAAGCPIEAASPMLNCVQENLTHLNQLRRSAILKRPRML